jgi:peptide/nickel transport system permease protein
MSELEPVALAAAPLVPTGPEASPARRAGKRDGALLLGVGLLLVLVAVAAFVPLLWPKDPNAIELTDALLTPSAAHPMGTDANGRDILARFAEGARISLTVGVAVALIGAILGTLVGVVAGIRGGWLGAALMRMMDALLAFPALVLAMAVTVGLGPGVVTAAIGISLLPIPWYARIVRSDVLRLRSQAYIAAAVTLGARQSRIVLRHVAPHLLPTILVQAAAVFSYAILALAGLGFVGLGAQVPTPEWGAMMTEGLADTLDGHWWLTVFPGLGVLLATTGAALLSDRGRDLLDPTSSRDQEA